MQGHWLPRTVSPRDDRAQFNLDRNMELFLHLRLGAEASRPEVALNPIPFLLTLKDKEPCHE